MGAMKVLRLERRPDARMQELLDAALQVFARKGYRTARLDDVAEAAGVTKGAIYHYFDTKEALLLGVIQHYEALAFGRAEEALRDDRLPAATRIRSLVRKVFAGRGEDTSHELLTLLVRGVAHEVPRVHDRWLRDGPARLWTLIQELVEEGKARGEFRPDADGEVGARLLVSGLMLQLMWQRHAPTVPGLALDFDRLIDSGVELFLASLRPVSVSKSKG
jgi:AcrR family transcriptional regulator